MMAFGDGHGCTDDMLEYLDDLRESGITNMYGAAPYVQEAFDLNKEQAKTVVLYWMRTFNKRHPPQSP